MISINKKGQIEPGEMVALIFTLLILVFYIIFIVLGSFKIGEMTSIIDAKDNVDAFTYSPDLINYLNTKIEVDGNAILMSDLLKQYVIDGKNEEIIEKEALDFLDKISHCYYEEGDIKKVGFVLFLSNGKRWTNIPTFEKWKLYDIWVINNGFYVIPKEKTSPFVYQRLDENNIVYLYREEGINAKKEECDNLE